MSLSNRFARHRKAAMLPAATRSASRAARNLI
jgi:hypothetical protein